MSVNVASALIVALRNENSYLDEHKTMLGETTIINLAKSFLTSPILLISAATSVFGHIFREIRSCLVSIVHLIRATIHLKKLLLFGQF
jgi:hypothetical protein